MDMCMVSLKEFKKHNLSAKDRLVLALDVDTIEEVERLVSLLKDYVGYFKVGPQLFISCAYDAIDTIKRLGGEVYFDGKSVAALPIVEIISENEFFDYEAKYNGKSKEICPADIKPELASEIQEVSRRLYVHLGCSGLVRFDYILADDGIYFLEVNTIPGMTNASLVPRMVRTAGIDMTEFLSCIINNS